MDELVILCLYLDSWLFWTTVHYSLLTSPSLPLLPPLPSSSASTFLSIFFFLYHHLFSSSSLSSTTYLSTSTITTTCSSLSSSSTTYFFSSTTTTPSSSSFSALSVVMELIHYPPRFQLLWRYILTLKLKGENTFTFEFI